MTSNCQPLVVSKGISLFRPTSGSSEHDVSQVSHKNVVSHIIVTTNKVNMAATLHRMRKVLCSFILYTILELFVLRARSSSSARRKGKNHSTT